MRVNSNRTVVVLLLAMSLLFSSATPALGAVGAVRIQGADRYETSAKTALTAY